METTPRQQRVTLKDLSRELGVSVPTVSRALKNSKEISPELCKRAHQLAAKRNYRPNPFAQSLRKGVPNLIGVIVPNIETHFNSSIIAGIEDCARRNGRSVICANSHELWEHEKDCVDNLVSLHVEGIIACLAQETTDYSHFEALKEMNIPLVFFARTCLPEFFSSVIADSVTAAHEATQHLIAQGCRRIAFIGGPNHLDMVRLRKHGYLEALRDAGIAIDRWLVKCDRMDHETAYNSMMELMELPSPPDAVIAVNNALIYGAMKAIKELKLRMPNDIKFIGFTDDRNVEYLTPSVSSIEDQTHLMGEHVCQMLLNRINGDTAIKHEIIPMQMMIRESSKKSHF